MEIRGYLSQLFVLGFEGKAIPQEFKPLLRKNPIGGIILFEENIEDTRQLGELIKEVQSHSFLPLFVMIDQEGGEKNRITKGIPQFPSNRFYGEKEDFQGATFAYRETAKALKGLGINVDLAPVVDLVSDPESSILGERSFGADANLVAKLSSLSVQAIQREGVMACAKHFPGLGEVDVDPHLALPSDPRGRDEFSSRDWLPFRATIASGVKLVMTTHLACPNVDSSGLPASHSREITEGILRSDLCFEGIIITDDLGMGAIRENFPLEEAVSLAIEAGVDLILLCHGFEEQLEVMEETLKNALRGEALREKIFCSYKRIMKAKENIKV